MNKKRKPNTSKICSQCKQPAVRDVLRTRVYNEVIIENVPATYCENCGEELYDYETMGMIDEILANPNRYATIKRMAVADFGAAQEVRRRARVA